MNYKKLVLAGVGVFALFITALNVMPFAPKTHADPTSFTWQDAQTITDNDGTTYIFQKSVTGGTRITGSGRVTRRQQLYEAVFVAQTKTASCNVNTSYSQTDGEYTYKNSDINNGGASALIIQTDTAQYNKGGQSAVGQASFISFANPANPAADSACQTNNYSHINLDNPSNAKSITFNWFDSSTIVNIPNGTIYKNSDSTHPTYYYATGSGNCHSWIVAGASKGEYWDSRTTKANGYTQQVNCWVKDVGPVTLGLQQNAAIQGSSTSGPVGTSSGSTPGNDATLDCNGGSLNWIICPVVLLAQGAANKLDSFITNTLNVDVKPIFDQTNVAGSASQGYYTAWNSFRILSTALLVIGGLVMVASQAIGFEFLDAYTVRKVLPRLLVAIIGISLSWPLMRLAVSFFDTLGFDVRALMYGPFKNFGGQLSNTTGFLTSGAIVGLLVVMGPAALTLLLTAFLAAFVGFIILVIRQVALIMLIILSPIAIACYILPNTQKVWKLWSDNFLGLLLMFPIISALIATGHIFSAVALKSGSGNTGSVPAQVIGLVAYFVPYFLLPLAARLATGVIGNLAGVVNDRGKGVFDRLKKVRGNATMKNLNNMKAGNRFSERNALTRGFNRTTVGAGTGWSGRFGMGDRGAQAIDQARRNAGTLDIMKSPKFAGIQHNDDALMAVTYNNAAQARAGLAARGWDQQRIDRSVGAAQASIGFGRPQAIVAAQQLAATGTGYQGYTDAQGNHVTALQEATQTIARASGGSRSTAASITGTVNSETKRAGRYDLAPGFGTFNDLVQNELTGGAKTRPGADSYHAASVAAARGVDVVTMLRGKPRQVEDLMGSLAQHAATTQAAAVNMSDGTPAGDQRRMEAKAEFVRTMGQVEQINQQKTYGSQQNQAFVNDLVNSTSGLQGYLTAVRESNPELDALYTQNRAPRVNGNDPNNATPEA